MNNNLVMTNGFSGKINFDDKSIAGRSVKVFGIGYSVKILSVK